MCRLDKVKVASRLQSPQVRKGGSVSGAEGAQHISNASFLSSVVSSHERCSRISGGSEEPAESSEPKFSFGGGRPSTLEKADPGCVNRHSSSTSPPRRLAATCLAYRVSSAYLPPRRSFLARVLAAAPTACGAASTTCPGGLEGAGWTGAWCGGGQFGKAVVLKVVSRDGRLTS